MPRPLLELAFCLQDEHLQVGDALSDQRPLPGEGSMIVGWRSLEFAKSCKLPDYRVDAFPSISGEPLGLVYEVTLRIALTGSTVSTFLSSCILVRVLACYPAADPIRPPVVPPGSEKVVRGTSCAPRPSA
jgi:hypothetical protein